MIERRPFHDLSGEDMCWLKAKRHFSFDGSDGRARQGWGALRIWNDDEIAPHAGFALHAHANLEIVTYVREGVLTHRDSLGNEGQTKTGDVQVMSAGTGIQHAEYNAGPVCQRLCERYRCAAHSGSRPRAWSPAHRRPVYRIRLCRRTTRISAAFVGHYRCQWRKD
jgi:quercetin 2,3-dioxygenase